MTSGGSDGSAADGDSGSGSASSSSPDAVPSLADALKPPIVLPELCDTAIANFVEAVYTKPAFKGALNRFPGE